ncbi:hypothetical protein [Methylobacterium fujisawaense]|uniref:hypothetical protein n=1 Tax=Methylobacterium fujisawaense TaxID=107400 RepID=UPI0037025CFA
MLFFRTYCEAALPLYSALVTDLCGSSQLPFQLATTLEDIGQGFMRLAEEVNGELARRGLLDLEADAELCIEAQIETVMTRFAASGLATRTDTDRHLSPALTVESFRQALRIALVMTHDLPIAGGP